jgi:hypothetical protein
MNTCGVHRFESSAEHSERRNRAGSREEADDEERAPTGPSPVAAKQPSESVPRLASGDSPRGGGAESGSGLGCGADVTAAGQADFATGALGAAGCVLQPTSSPSKHQPIARIISALFSRPESSTAVNASGAHGFTNRPKGKPVC